MYSKRIARTLFTATLVLLANCEYVSAPVDPEGGVVLPSGGASPINPPDEVQRGSSQTYVIKPDGWVTNGITGIISERADLATGSIVSLTKVAVTCHKRGFGVLYVDLKGPQGELERAYRNFRCVDRLRTPVNKTMNLTVRFANMGLVVKGFSVDPNDLAERVALGAKLSHQSSTTVSAQSVAISDEGDIEVSCRREGEGTIVIYFDSGQNDYDMQCDPAHDQGGGS